MLADYMARGLTDEEAAALAGIDPDTLTEWNKVPEFSGAVKAAKARRMLERMDRIEQGEQGWQGTAWALERLHPKRFARPEVLIQNNVMAAANAQGSEAISPERLAEIQRLRRGALDGQGGGVVIDAETLAAIQAAQERAREFGRRIGGSGASQTGFTDEEIRQVQEQRERALKQG